MIPEKQPLGKLPSFTSFKKKDDTEDRGGAVPLLSGPQEILNEAAAIHTKGIVGKASFAARLSQLKSNEMAFILAGLGLLILAPLIELVVNRSSSDQASLRSEFDNPSFLPEPGDLKEIGISRMAAGGLFGQNDRVIKRLDAPDPMKLIETGDMDLARVSQGIVEAPARKKEPSSDKSNWEDALSMAAKGSVAQANRSAGLPRPNSKVVGKLTGALSGLQGLAALNVGGGGSASANKSVSLAPPNSQGITGTAQRSDSLTHVQLPPEFHGGAKRGPDASGGSPASFLNSAPSLFSRPPSGVTAEGPGTVQPQVGPTQSPGGGRPSEGEAIKSPVLNSAKDARAIQTVKSLSQEMAEYNAKKQADLNWAIQQYNQIDKPKMILQQKLQTAGQLANTALQGAFDLLKTALQKMQQAQGQQGAAGGAAADGSGTAGAGDGSDGSAVDAVGGVRRDPSNGNIVGQGPADAAVGPAQ